VLGIEPSIQRANLALELFEAGRIRFVPAIRVRDRAQLGKQVLLLLFRCRLIVASHDASPFLKVGFRLPTRLRKAASRRRAGLFPRTTERIPASAKAVASASVCLSRPDASLTPL
jgi:hypothetical protein